MSDETLNRIKAQFEKCKIIPHDQAQAERHKIKVNEIRQGWNVPLRHLKTTDIEHPPEWSLTEKTVIEKISSGFLVALIGTRGTGKTQIAVHAMKAATERLKTARYASATEFFMDIKATYKPTCAISERDVILEFRKPQLLVLDELGKRAENDWEARLLFELLDKRYHDEKDTILISNESRKEFLESIGPSLASRMSETGGIIECQWKSFRQ